MHAAARTQDSWYRNKMFPLSHDVLNHEFCNLSLQSNGLYIYIYIYVSQQTLWWWLCWLKGRELGGMGSIWATGKRMITNVKLPQTTFMFFQNLKSRLYDLSSGWKTQEEKIDELIMGQIGLRFWAKRPAGRLETIQIGHVPHLSTAYPKACSDS